MRLVERQYNASARQWVVVQQTRWMPYVLSYSMTLASRGGSCYIQAWVADSAGNISEATRQARIDYMPPSESLRAGQARIYRRDVEAGQTVTAQLETISGDADVYVWSPDGARSWASASPAACPRTTSATCTYHVAVAPISP